MTDIVLIYATFSSSTEAERIGGALIEQGLAACVNILPAITSIYVWEGKLSRDQEAAMLIKTRAKLADRVIAEARALHSYANPAFLVLPVVGGSTDFLAWVRAGTAAP